MTADPARRWGVAALLLAATTALSACGKLIPTQVGPVIDIDGVGPATMVEFEVEGPDPALARALRWTGARAVRQTEDGRLLVVWSGGPIACWDLASVQFTARGRQLGASVGESAVPRPGRCDGERSLFGVFVPGVAAPARGETSAWPLEP